MGEARHVAEEFVEAFNAHDEARMRNLDRDDVSFEGPGDVSLTGPDATTAYAMAWIHAFPDARIVPGATAFTRTPRSAHSTED